jgi:hypothetical protein
MSTAASHATIPQRPGSLAQRWNDRSSSAALRSFHRWPTHPHAQYGSWPVPCRTFVFRLLFQ